MPVSNRIYNFRDMIQADIMAFPGDSGSTLVRMVGANAQAVGIAIASDGQGSSLFTHAANIRQISYRMIYQYHYWD